MCSYRNICKANITRLIEYIHIETCKACNIVKQTKENHIAVAYKKNTKKYRMFSRIFEDLNWLKTHVKIVHDTAPTAP